MSGPRHSSSPARWPRPGDAELRRLQRHKSDQQQPAQALGPEFIGFFKSTVQKRQTRLQRISDTFTALVPPTILEHCAIEALSHGTLTVLVDSSAHLYDLKQLLLAGLQKQLVLACRSAGLNRITLKPGRWYSGETPGDRRPEF